MVPGTGRRGGFFADENNPFFWNPPPQGGEMANTATWQVGGPSHVGRCKFTPLGLQIMLKKDSLGQRRR